MIDIKDLRERPEAYQKACNDKRIKFNVSDFLKLDEEYRKLKSEVEKLRAEQNLVSKDVPKLQGAEKEACLDRMKILSASVKQQSQELKELETKWEQLTLRLPAIALDSVPLGKDDSENLELRKEGQIPEFNFPIRDHAELGKSLGIIDIERGVKIAGARSYFLKGDGARLQHAVMNLAIDLLHKRGFSLMDCPHLVKYSAMQGTSYFPGGEDMAYHLDERDSDYYLIGTSEVSVCSYHADEILDYRDLPLRYAGYSPCYRREAGTYGKDTQGLYRVHQFYKVEQVVISENSAAASSELHAELLKNSEDLLKLLNLPYRVVAVCTGDMGQGQVYKNDIEVWMPSRNSYGETHSCSSFYDFQARRLQIRYRDQNGDIKYCHTLNNTCVASPRFLIPLLEMNQLADGSVKIPEVLRPYLGGQEFIKAEK